MTRNVSGLPDVPIQIGPCDPAQTEAQASAPEPGTIASDFSRAGHAFAAHGDANEYSPHWPHWPEDGASDYRGASFPNNVSYSDARDSSGSRATLTLYTSQPTTVSLALGADMNASRMREVWFGDMQTTPYAKGAAPRTENRRAFARTEDPDQVQTRDRLIPPRRPDEEIGKPWGISAQALGDNVGEGIRMLFPGFPEAFSDAGYNADEIRILDGFFGALTGGQLHVKDGRLTLGQSAARTAATGSAYTSLIGAIGGIANEWAESLGLYETWDKFLQACIAKATAPLTKLVRDLVLAELVKNLGTLPDGMRLPALEKIIETDEGKRVIEEFKKLSTGELDALPKEVAEAIKNLVPWPIGKQARASAMSFVLEGHEIGGTADEDKKSADEDKKTSQADRDALMSQL